MARILSLTLVSVIGLGLSARAEVVKADDPNAAVKAAYLDKLTPFIEWPASAFDTPDAPFSVCVIGDDPFGPLLDQAVAGQSAAGRAMVVRRMTHLTVGVSCQIVYAAGAHDLPVAEILHEVHGAPVLTVTDSAPDGAKGIIDLVVGDGRVRFDIDDQAAADNGLTISSKLLSLAITVRARK